MKNKLFTTQLSKSIQKTYVALIFVLLYLPMVVLIVLSVNKARFSMQWTGFSLQWYNELLQDSELWSAFMHSISLGLLSSGISLIVATAACLSIVLKQHANHISQKNKTLFNLVLLPIVLPDLIIAVGLLLFFNVTAMPLGFWSLLIAHVSFCIPFVVLTLNTRCQTLDPNLYNSAIDLGASRSIAITKVILPVLRPTLLSAFLLAFTLSFDDVIISYFVAGPDFNILPLAIFAMVRTGVTPELNALCAITLMISMVLVIIAYRTAKELR